MSKNKKEEITFFNGDWHLVKEIGSGSFATVYKAYKESFGQKIYSAIKVIKVPNDSQDLKSLKASGMSKKEIKDYCYEYVKAFLEEIRLMQSLKAAHNIVIIDDYEVIEDGESYLINIRMELLESYDDFFENNKITDKLVLKMGIDICTVLEYCLRKNIIHRDIKPDNIFVSDMGDFKLGDFGIAKIVNSATDGLSRKGTELYMSPEVNRGDESNTTIDIYSLALVLYRCFNYNRLPFYPNYPNPITYSAKEEAKEKRFKGSPIPLPLNASEKIGKVICKACSYDLKDRYQNPTEFKNALVKLYDNIAEEKVLEGVNNNVNDRIESKQLATTKSIFDTELDTTNVNKVNTRKIKKPKIKINLRKIINRKTIKIGTICLLSCLVIVFGIYGYKKITAERNNTYIMSLVIGKKLNEIDKNIKYKIEYEETTKENVGLIIKQSVKENEKINNNDVVILTIGIDNEKITVPDLSKMTLAEATSTLEQLGLSISSTYANNDDIAKDTIISQMTEANTEVNKGSAIEVLVSSGPSIKEFSTWVTSLPSNVNESKYVIETKVEYRYKTKETTTSNNNSLAGYSLYDTTTSYSAWGDNKTAQKIVGNSKILKDEKPTESDLLEIIDEKYDKYQRYYHVDIMVGSKAYVESCEIRPGITKKEIHYIELKTSLEKSSWPDYCGKQAYYYSKPCSWVNYIWYYWGIYEVTVYTYHERSLVTTYHFYKWSDFTNWSTNRVTANDNTIVESRTLYRYKDK